MKGLSWKAIIVGFIVTLAAVLGLATVSIGISDIWYDDWKKEWISENFEEGKQYKAQEVQSAMNIAATSYYQQPKWIALMSVLMSLGFIAGGFVTGKISKRKELIHSCIVGGAVSLLKITLLFPLFVVCAMLGGYLAARHSKIQSNIPLQPTPKSGAAEL